MNKSSLSFRASVLAAGNGTAALVQMVVAAILARQLTEASYGTYKQTYLVYQLATPLLAMGLPAALLYFLPRNPERGRRVLTETLLVLLAGGMLCSSFLWLGGAELIAKQFDNPELASALRWFAFGLTFAFPLLAVPPCLIATNRPTWVAGYTITTGMLRMALVLIPVLLISQTALMAIKGATATTLLMTIPALFLMYRAVNKGRITLTREGIIEQVKYAAPLGIGAMIGKIHKGMDKTIVSSMVGPGEAAVFFNGAMEIPFISLLTGSAAAVMVPEISKLYSEGKKKQGLQIFQSSAVKCGTILAPLAGWFFISAPWVMTWLYGASYIDSTPIFRIYLLIIPLRVAFFGPLFQAAGRSDLVMTRSIVGFLGNIVLTIILTKLLGPIGAAIGTVLSILLFSYVYCVVTSASLYETSVWKLLPLAKLATRFLPVVVAAGALYLMSIAMQWEQTLSFVGWLILSSIYVIVIGAVYWYMQFFTPMELVSRRKK